MGDFEIDFDEPRDGTDEVDDETDGGEVGEENCGGRATSGWLIDEAERVGLAGNTGEGLPVVAVENTCCGSCGPRRGDMFEECPGNSGCWKGTLEPGGERFDERTPSCEMRSSISEPGKVGADWCGCEAAIRADWCGCEAAIRAGAGEGEDARADVAWGC